MTVKKKNQQETPLLCSFCGKSQEIVKKLVAGPDVYICDECIELCNEILIEEAGSEFENNFDTLPVPEKLKKFLISM